MRYFRLLVALMAVLFVNLSCGLLGSAEKNETMNGNSSDATPGSTLAPEAYPAPGSVELLAYPTGENPSQLLEKAGAMLYPELKDGDTIEWYQVQGAVYSGMVKEIVQTHDLKVYLTFVDGRTLVSTAPAIDDVQKIINDCGVVCQGIKFATE